jgi:K+-sensing histidine kinase KdpD
VQSFKSITVGIITSLCISLLVAVLLFRSIDQQADTQQSVDHTYQVIDLIDEFELTLQKVERNESSYLLTQDEHFFEEFQVAAKNLPLSINKIAVLTSDNPTQQGQIQSLKLLLTQHLHSLQSQLDMVHKKQAPRDKIQPIKLKVEYAQQEITLSVRDEGIGIPEEDLRKIFEPFQRGSNVGQTPGTGLGLATVQACVSRHGGSLSLKSEEGKYTIFIVHLPTHGFGDSSSSMPSAGKSFP